MALFPNPFAGQSTTAQQPVLPRVPYRSNPMITTAALSLLGGRNLNEGLANVAATAPAGMAAKSGMQQFMLAQQEREAQKAEQEARKAQLNEVIKNYPNIPEQLRPVFMAQPELFPQYAVQSTMPADPTDDIREYQKAVEQGFTGGFMDYMTAMKKAGASVTNIDNIGSIPQGYEVFKTPEGGTQMRPIPGGPADTSAKDAAKQEQTALSADVVVQDIRRAKDKAKNAPWYDPAVGFGAETLAENVGGSSAADVRSLLNTISSSVAFDRLQQMREASPTGGALGAVSDTELKLLRDALGSLAQGQSKQQFIENLDRLEVIYTRIMEKAGAYPNAGQFGFAPSAGGGSGGDGWTEVEPGIRIREKP